MPVSADTIALLLAKGVSAADLVDVVRAIDADAAQAVPVRTARQERNARYYRNRRDRAANASASETVLNQTPYQDASSLSASAAASEAVLIKTSDQDVLNPPPSPPKRYNQTPTPTPTSLRSVTARAEDAFAAFWSAYPRREGANPKQPALAKFVRLVLGGEDAQAIIGGAERYAASVAQTDPRFTAQAVTWLNQVRWRDEHVVASPPVRAGPAGSGDGLAEARRILAERMNGRGHDEGGSGRASGADARDGAADRGPAQQTRPVREPDGWSGPQLDLAAGCTNRR